MNLEMINKKIEDHFIDNETQNVLLIKYGEIALRGRNRGIFEMKLINNIKKNLKDLKGTYFVQKEQGRFVLINLDGELDFDLVIPRVTTVLGTVAIAKCVRTKKNDIETIKKVALDVFKDSHKTGSYKVDSKRSDKNYPLKSNDISRTVGDYIWENTESPIVDLKNPDFTLHIELRNHVYYYTDLVKTFGGLPSGSSGKGVLLLSGGIDSPVSGFVMAKRGVEIIAVYFDSPPYTSERAKQKVIDLAKRLDDFTGTIKLYVIPFTETQLYLYNNTPEEKLTILLKHTMIKVATKIAEKEKAYGLIMGDSVGQVASQTMLSILAVEGATDLPIYRPLAGMDKQEIVNIAKTIDTFDISARPFEDCCTVFVPKSPETKPKRHIIESIARRIEEDLTPLIDKSIEECEIIKFDL
ncbi:MAG: tRNA uracil 4-sulfurtransferase ThiI [Lachnospirales bacterium]